MLVCWQLKLRKQKMDIKIIETITDTKYGFCSVHFTLAEDDKEYTLQACLALKKPIPATVGKGPEYKKEVNGNDCGFDWGICGDVNEAAIKRLGFDQCWQIFKRGARACGVVIVKP